MPEVLFGDMLHFTLLLHLLPDTWPTPASRRCIYVMRQVLRKLPYQLPCYLQVYSECVFTIWVGAGALVFPYLTEDFFSFRN